MGDVVLYSAVTSLIAVPLAVHAGVVCGARAADRERARTEGTPAPAPAPRARGRHARPVDDAPTAAIRIWRSR